MVKNMVRKYGTVQVGFILIVLLGASLAFIPVVPADEPMASDEPKPKMFSFNSYIDIEYDASVLNKNLQIDQSINVPLTIEYRTDVPENFLKWMPWQIKNIILYGSMIGPNQQINLEIEKKPDWADISIAQKDVLVPIPNKGSPVTEKTSIILSPYEEAPARPYTITIRATCGQIGRINSFDTSEDLVFTPSFTPTVTIIPDEPTRTVGPRESVNFKISVKNEANKKARIIPRLNRTNDDWSPTINPPFFDVLPGEKEDFTFSVYTPYNFGWHNEIQSFQIDFTTQIFPLQEDAPEGGPYAIYLRINNYGFSTPGFELLPFMAALFIAGILIRKRYR